MAEFIDAASLVELLTSFIPMGTMSGLLVSCPVIGAGLLVKSVSKLLEGV